MISSNNDIIKKEFTLLFKKLSVSKENGESVNIDHFMRKLTRYISPEIPQMSKIEEEIVKNVKQSNLGDDILTDVQNYIRKIRNMSIRDPARLLLFLMELSPLCTSIHSKETAVSSSLNIKPFISLTKSAENLRMSTPLQRSQGSVNKMPLVEMSSLTNHGKSIRGTPVAERYLTNSFQNISEYNTNNSSIKQQKSSHNYQISNELTEYAIVGDLLYVILGCNGQYFYWDKSLMRLGIVKNAVISPNMICLISKLAKIGVAYSEIRSYVDRIFRSQSKGVVCQGLCSALNEHLGSYTNLVSVLHSQYNSWSAELEKKGSQEDCLNKLTLQRLLLWLHDPTETIFFLMTIVHNVSEKKGGDLASSLFIYLLNGASNNNKLLRHLLLSAVEPIFQFIEQWIYDGVLEECHAEFFVEVNTKYEMNSTWTKKYGLRTSMIPTFISTLQAEKILLAGKSINFLREICEEKAIFKNSREYYKMRNITAESMINQDVDRSFGNMIDNIYEETSKNLLEVMFKKYRLMGHLKALRKYMLQGQGDFILRLIEILGPELSKPSTDLRAHNMMGPLDEALKTTNAQYDSREILDRIDIKLLKVSDNETGWDVFTLNYHITDVRPLLAVVDNDSFFCYLRTFTFLFRSRRVHFILNNFFKRQNSSRRAFSTMPEVSKVIHFSQIIILEMLHFVNQIQYYINFEVLEASWKIFTESVGKAKDLDSVMRYHELFLKQITERCLLEPESRDILANLRTIYDLIISFETLLEEMFSCFENELRFRASFKDQVEQYRREGKWGVNDAREKKEQSRITSFSQLEMVGFQHKLKSHHTQYESQVVRFLSTLVNHHDSTLRRLYTNLDFNYRYKDLIRDYRRN